MSPPVGQCEMAYNDKLTKKDTMGYLFQAVKWVALTSSFCDPGELKDRLTWNNRNRTGWQNTSYYGPPDTLFEAMWQWYSFLGY